METTQDRQAALSLESLYKSYGDIKAVKGINLTLKRGEILGLLGPNGSGKSTTMKMVLGILKPDSGEIFVYGEKETTAPAELKKKLGYVPETPQLYEFLTGVEYIDFVDEVVDELQCRDAINYIHNILRDGTGADRQLKKFEEAGDLKAVVDYMAEETQAGLF